MAKDKPSPSASNRRNLYWTEEMDKDMELLAPLAEKAGWPGIILSSGEINRTAMVRYLIDFRKTTVLEGEENGQ